MTPHPERPGPISTVIDIALVVVILGCGGILLWSAIRVAVFAIRAVARWRRPRRWPRNGGDQ